MTTPTIDQLRAIPKVLLHDHLEGGLRASTLVELAADLGRDLPVSDPAEVEAWLHGRLPGPDRHPAGAFGCVREVMQTREALVRVAEECGLDLAADGVAYAEVRLTPEHHTDGGLELDSVMGAVFEGFHLARARTDIDLRIICASVPDGGRAAEVAELAVRWRGGGVVGFDLADVTGGRADDDQIAAMDLIGRHLVPVTMHTGATATVGRLADAVVRHGAQRIGHGMTLVDDITVDPDGSATLGRLASHVRDRRLAIEMCPSADVRRGAVHRLDQHPIDLLHRLRFRVTVNTDSRLGGRTLSEELERLCRQFDLTLADVEQFTLNAAKSAFLPFDERVRLVETRLVPGFLAVGTGDLGHSATDAELRSLVGRRR